MFGRPRCREWTPLATQQLRLRSLIQIVGYNIRPPEFCNSQCSYYVTLHHTSMSAPFYTSERISSPHPKWKEIDSETTQCMSASNVVIRIWCHMLTNQIDELSDLPQDTVIQTWGVYFSGLRYIGANLALNFTSDCFKSNTLVFQMHGGYFCSYKSLKLDVIPPENEIEHGSVSSSSSNDTSSSKVTLESRFIQNNKIQSRSVSPSNKFARADGYSKSQSPVERGFKQPLPKMRSLNSLSVHQARRRDDAERDIETTEIYEHSPESSDVRVFTMTDKNCDILKRKEEANVDVSETAESYDLRSESCWTPKYRYLALNFLKSEIRPSYNSVKLQKLHLLQYSIKKRQEAVKDIKERIYSKSALSQEEETIEENLRLRLKSRSQRNVFASDDSEVIEKSDLGSQNGRVNVDNGQINGARKLKLNDLLSFKSKPSPFQRSEQIRLTKQLEILRFKRIILADERDSKLVNIRRLKETYSKLCEENQDVGTELMQAYHTLSRQTDSLKEACQSALAVRELAARSHAAMQSRRAELVHSLLSVFPIEQSETPGPNGVPIWQICSISLGVCGDSRQYSIQDATSDCAAAGLVAQAVCLLAALCNLPTRYSIQLMGSATTVVDTTADLPNPEIPLFARGGDVTLFRYAMFLLNKCIAQLMYARGLHVTDMRPTLANLRRLITSPPHVSETAKLFGTYKWLDDSEYPRTQSLRSLVASDRGKHGRQFNRFKQTVDGQSPQSLKYINHSRSVGSYHDDHELSLASTAPNMGSEPNIYNHKQTLTESTTHNSDSDLSKINQNDSKVYFTLGENECLQDISSKLVKMSTNNDDEYLSGDVKRICDQIEDYCSSEPVERQMESLKDSMENLDIAKYMQGKDSNEECPENDGLSENVDCLSNVETSEVVDSVIQDENSC